MQYRKKKKPWPTKDAMAQIYEQNLWGGDAEEFYSGEGSYHPKYVDPYVKVVSDFLMSFQTPPTVCDLGCGDFNVGKQLAPFATKYIGVDIVPALIESNKERYQASHLEFCCLDIAEDDLPKAEVALLRNVLQHISNAEIMRVTQKLAQYSYLILTEHIPEGEFEPNVDIISGQGIRLKKNSGVDLTAEPFWLIPKRRQTLLRIPFDEGKGVLQTTLFEL